MTNLSWIDLPDDDYVAILGYRTEDAVALNILVKKYNQIPKDQAATLPCRIKKLEEIAAFLEDWVENRLKMIDKKKHLLWLLEMAIRKRNYLFELQIIYDNGLHLEEAQIRYHTDISSLKDPKKNAVILNPRYFFSIKMLEYWGDFWYETLDPCHRRVTPFLNQWRELQKQYPEVPHFFLWLETQHIPKYVPRVTYLRDKELEKQRVIIKDGLFWKKSSFPWELANWDDSSQRYLFVIDLSEEIYVAEEVHGISHSSFTCGKPVLGGGLLQVERGRLKLLALESGHYMPTIETGHQILKIFEEKGVLFPDNLELVFFHDRSKYRVSLEMTPVPSLEIFKEILESFYMGRINCVEPCMV